MRIEDFERYLGGLGFRIETIRGNDSAEYVAIRDVVIPRGGLAGHRCDIAVLRTAGAPYLPQAAIHTRPALVRMLMAHPIKTQVSGIGPEWQYWSRRFDGAVNPQTLWARILAILCDEQWTPTQTS